MSLSCECDGLLLVIILLVLYTTVVSFSKLSLEKE